MAPTTWALPVGILAALCVCMFVFIWWWFPRHYRKGIAMDMKEVDDARRARELSALEEGQAHEMPQQPAETAKPKPQAFLAPVVG